MERKPTLLYYFTHQYLRNLVQNNFAFFDSVVRQGPQVFEKAIRQTFETLKRYDLEETDINLAENDFTLSLATLGQNKVPLLVIKLPKPRHTTEASHVGIVLGRPVRYFTLELHIPIELEKQINPEMQTKYFLCEWKENVHHLLNKSFLEPDPTKFSGAIEAILASN